MTDPAQVTQWAREFGVMVAVLFVILLTGISFMWFLIGKQGRTVEEIKELLVLHAKGTDVAIGVINTIRGEVDSFRASERDLLTNLKETVILHAKSCDSGQGRLCETQKDVDAIGKSVEKLVTLLTMKRRNGSDDADRAPKPD